MRDRLSELVSVSNLINMNMVRYNIYFQSRGPDEPGDTVVNIENDSEGPYMQDFFGDVSTFDVLACVKNTGQGKTKALRKGWSVLSCFHY